MDLELPIRAHMVKPGMRIAINARHSLNPSLVAQRLKCVPMTCQVSHVVKLDNESAVIIEGNNHYMFKVGASFMLQELAKKPTAADDYKPQLAQHSATFKGVSIE